MNPQRQASIARISRLIHQSSFKIFSDSEITNKTVISQPEFETRAMDFIKDPESGLSVSDDEAALAKAILARMYRQHLPPAVARAYMAPLELAPSYTSPAKRPKTQRAKR